MNDSMTDSARLNWVTNYLTGLGVTIEPKASAWYWKVLDVLLKIVSFGQMKTFMNGYHTTIGTRIGLAPVLDMSSDAERYAILLHELRHIQQYRRYGFGNIWLGFALATIPYLFLPFPIGFAWCRMKMEKEGYEATIRAWVQCYGKETARHGKDNIVKQFTGVGYLFMWPFKSHMDAWFDTTLERICREEGV